MASKALKIVGIGCGAMVLIAVIGVALAGYWVKGKVEGMGEWAEKMETQQKELNALEEQFAFKAPAEGETVELTEARLSKYLAIRRGLEPAMAKFEASSKKLEKKNGEEASMSDGLAALSAMGDLTFEVRAAFIAQLQQAKMSPSEFHAIRDSILMTMGDSSAEAAELLASHKEELEKHQNSIGFDALLVADDSVQ